MDERNLLIGSFVRKAGAHGRVLLNPTGAMLTTNPMNVAAVHEDGSPLFVLPLDYQRLTRTSTKPEHRKIFRDFWDRIDGVVGEEPESAAPIWELRTAVGFAFDSQYEDDWVEYDRPGPWLEIGRLEPALAVLVLLERDEPNDPDARYVCPTKASDITVYEAAVCLYKSDGYANLAHFAVLNPVSEAWISAGEYTRTGLKDVRRRFSRWPQRAANREVLLEA